MPPPVPSQTKTAVHESTGEANKPIENLEKEVLYKGLTLSSIQVIKNSDVKKQGEINPQNLPKTPFSEEQLHEVWKAYLQKLKGDGQQNLSSLLGMGEPILKPDYIISIKVMSENQKNGILQGQGELLDYIRKALDNFYIHLDITVDHTISVLQKTVMISDQEVYQKLCEINPNIEILKQAFDLDIRG